MRVERGHRKSERIEDDLQRCQVAPAGSCQAAAAAAAASPAGAARVRRGTASCCRLVGRQTCGRHKQRSSRCSSLHRSRHTTVDRRHAEHSGRKIPGR